VSERTEINLAHINELPPDYLKQLAEKRNGWEIISSVSGEYGKALILWDTPNGVWIEERGWKNGGDRKRRITRLISPECVRQAVKKLAGLG